MNLLGNYRLLLNTTSLYNVPKNLPLIFFLDHVQSRGNIIISRSKWHRYFISTQKENEIQVHHFANNYSRMCLYIYIIFLIFIR